MVNAASTSNPSFIVDVGGAYPYPSHFTAPNFVTTKLSGKDMYDVWETQILCLLKSHEMYGFIDGKFPSPAANEKGKEGDIDAWTISDSLVKGWILGSLSDVVAKKVVKHLKAKHKNPDFKAKHKNPDFTAKDVWDELKRSYGPLVREHVVVAGTTLMTRRTRPREIIIEQLETEADDFNEVYRSILEGCTRSVIELLEKKRYKPWHKLTPNGNTVLHVAVASSTKNHELLKELLGITMPEEYTLLDVVNSDGSSLLHIAAIGGNIEVVNILVEKNPELLLAKDKEGHTPLALCVSNMHIKISHCLYEHMTKKEYNALFSGQSGEDLAVLAISCEDFSLAYMIVEKHFGTAILSGSDAVLVALGQNFPPELNIWERGWKESFQSFAPDSPFVKKLDGYFAWPCSRQLSKIFSCFFIGTL